MKKLIAFLLLSFFISEASAQHASKTYRSAKGQVVYLKGRPAALMLYTKSAAISFLKTLAAAPSGLTFAESRTVANADQIHSYFDVYWKGLPCIGIDMVVHSQKGQISFANGNVPLTYPSNAKPGLTGERARFIAVGSVAKVYPKAKAADLRTSESRLVWYFLDGKALLAYEIDVEANQTLLRGTQYVDAHTGESLAFISDIHFHDHKPLPNVTGTAATLYSGLRQITTNDDVPGTFRLRELRDGTQINTMNANNQTNEDAIAANATDFVDNDNNWGAAEHAGDVQAHDAHWATERVLDYWKTEHNRNSLDNASLPVTSYIHVANNWDNAGWSNIKKVMYYGDGEFFFSPLTSLDVVAHELGHGICYFTSRLRYRGESGALNEGFSDIWSATIEEWADPTKAEWLQAEEIFLLAPGHLRNMSLPANGNPPQPDTYLGTFWANTNNINVDSGGVHTNSGVLNYWYFLLAQGGSGTNDNGTAFNVNGIGFQSAARIAYRTEQLLNSNSDFAMCREISEEAAIQLFGVQSCEHMAVQRAWVAVGVGGPANETTPYEGASLTSNDLIICGPKTFSVMNALAGSTVISWTSSDPALAQFVSGSSLDGTFLLTGTGYVTITAELRSTTGCGGPIYTAKQEIYVGQEFTGGENLQDDVTGNNNSVCLGNTFSVWAPSYNSAISYTWTSSPNITITGGAGTPGITAVGNTAGPGEISVTINTHCGSTTITQSYYIGSQYDGAVQIPFSLFHDCSTGNAGVLAQSYREPTVYHWRLTGYRADGSLHSDITTSTTNPLYNFTIPAEVYNGTICLQVDRNGCGLAPLRCREYTRPCPRGGTVLDENTEEVQIASPAQAWPQGFALYPNPVKSVLNVRLPSPSLSAVLAEILDATGKKVSSERFGNGTQGFTLRVQGTPGMYLLRLTFNGQTQTHKFWKE